MKKIIFAINIIWMVSPSILSAQINVENIFSQANELYNKGSYIEAINNYKEIIKNDFHSAELYYNLGNAYYRLDSIASSVYYYEKALQLNPNDREILFKIYRQELEKLGHIYFVIEEEDREQSAKDIIKLKILTSKNRN